MKSVDSGSTAVFEYDGDGNRSVKTSTLETRIYFYDLNRPGYSGDSIS